jgi:hypothetical protein
LLTGDEAIGQPAGSAEVRAFCVPLDVPGQTWLIL